jgi:hypothetical protein
MNRLAFLGLTVTGILVLASPAVADEREERAEALLQKAAELAGQGHVEDAERLEREALELRKSAQREPAGNVESLIGKFEEQLRVMRAEAERLEATEGPIADRFALEKEIAHTERKLDELIAQREGRLAESDRPKGEIGSPPHEGKVPAAAERIKHVLAAAEHLAAAGMHDAGHDLRRRAEQMEQELRHAKQSQQTPGAPHQDALHNLARQMEELRQEMRRMQEELHALRKHVNSP